jgi:integrase/recombinase XerD
MNSYLVYMRTEYVPSRWSGDTRNLSPKTLRNIWITMCSFFRRANTEFQIEGPMKNVPSPRFQKVEIELFTRGEVTHMVKACVYSNEADTSYRRQFVMRRPTSNRDQAVILTLLDSGIGVSEFSALRVADFEAKKGKLEICNGVEGEQKVGRVVYLGKTARQAVWGYLAEREDGEDPNGRYSRFVGALPLT